MDVALKELKVCGSNHVEIKVEIVGAKEALDRLQSELAWNGRYYIIERSDNRMLIEILRGYAFLEELLLHHFE